MHATTEAQPLGLLQPLADVDAVLQSFAPALGKDFDGYRHHIYRALNFYRALAGGGELPLALRLAVPFHDLGIWVSGRWDYLEPSWQLAHAALQAQGRLDLAPTVQAIVHRHHQIRRYTGADAHIVETYRRADWIDVSAGWLRFGLPRAYVRAVQQQWPDAGFHRRLLLLTLRELRRRPWRPLPMLRW